MAMPNRENRIAPQTAAQKPVTCRPPSKPDAAHSISPLTTKRNRPTVSKVTGKVSKTSTSKKKKDMQWAQPIFVLQRRAADVEAGKAVSKADGKAVTALLLAKKG